MFDSFVAVPEPIPVPPPTASTIAPSTAAPSLAAPSHSVGVVPVTPPESSILPDRSQQRAMAANQMPTRNPIKVYKKKYYFILHILCITNLERKNINFYISFPTLQPLR